MSPQPAEHGLQRQGLSAGSLEPDTLKPTEFFIRHLLDGLVASGRARHIVGATYRFEDRALARGERFERELRFGAAAEKAARFRALPVILDRPSVLAERRECVFI